MFTTGWAAARRRSACRTADVLALKSLLGRLQLLVAYAAVLSLYFTGTFISYLSPTLEVKRPAGWREQGLVEATEEGSWH